MSSNPFRRISARLLPLAAALLLLPACGKSDDEPTDDGSGSGGDSVIEVDDLPAAFYMGGEYELAANASDVAWTLEPESIGFTYRDGDLSRLVLSGSGDFLLTGMSPSLTDTLRVAGTSLYWTLLVQSNDTWSELTETAVPAGGTLRCALGYIDSDGGVTRLSLPARWTAQYESDRPYAEAFLPEGSSLTLTGLTASSAWTLTAVYGTRRVSLTVR